VSETAAWLDQHRADLSPLQRALTLSAAADAKADAADQRGVLARQAAADERVELLTLANRQGDPIGQLSRFRAECAAADDECRDLADRLAKATAKRDRLDECIRGLAGQVDEITALLQRAEPLSGVEGAVSRAQEALREVQAERRVDAMLSRPVTRPKEVSRSRGAEVARSEFCVYCTEAGVDDETSYLLHSDPELNCPVTSPEQAAQAERRQYAGHGREISR
jgi:hypothetical protein